MSLELYLAFVLATAILIVMPGPNVTLIVAHAIGYGSRRALVTVFGTQCAQAVQLGFVALGMTTLIVAFVSVFEWVRWIGVAYLIWLGVQRWRAGANGSERPVVETAPPKTMFWQGFFVGVTNPKTWLFYAAFFPQFVDPAVPVGRQLLVLSVTYLAIATALDSGYALLAGRARGWLQLGRRKSLADRITGTILIGAGVWLALARRT